ncbi:uncharacterized protein LOC101852715 isoform X2 [Aplysia californica]|uniref:Uncharacterized protein LOC101852715 isoform X2 n=1 Tax=Aplysia californica TaxID=6500 RepID=A0ABM1VY92_APLCA|nr:uncharacterized protein LOC101852715 isoform X2 [Aplysia californica]
MRLYNQSIRTPALYARHRHQHHRPLGGRVCVSEVDTLANMAAISSLVETRMASSVKRDVHLLHTFAHLSLLFLYNVEAATHQVLLQKYSCASPSNLTGSLVFTSVQTKAECAVKCFDTCVAIVVNPQGSSSINCAVLTSLQHIPSHSMVSCSDPLNSAVVYKNNKTNYECNSTITVFGRQHCLHDTGTNTDSHSEAESVCQAMGGQLPEADTLANMAAIASIFTPPEFIWMGANDLVTDGTYLWPSGVEVDVSFWEVGEPHNRAKESCTALSRFNTLLLVNIICEGFSVPVHVVCDIVSD